MYNGAAMNRRSLISAAAVIVTLVAMDRAVIAKPGIAVLGLEVRDLEANVDEKTTKMATDLTAGLRREAKAAASPYSLVPNADRDLTEVKVINMCEDAAVGCMSDIGKDLKADRLLYGSITRRKNGYQVSLDLLDVKKKAMERSTSELIPFGEANAAGVARWSKTLYGRLTGSSAESGGTLVVTANADSGQVLIDGKPRGKLSGGTARITGVSPGSHTVGVQASGFKNWSGDATVTDGETTKVPATLEKSGGDIGDDDDDDDDDIGGGGGGGGGVDLGGDKPLPGKASRILFWTSLLATGASAAAMTVTGLQVRGKLKDDQLQAVEALANRPSNPIMLDEANACSDAEGRPVDDGVQAVLDACSKGRSRAMLTNIFLGATVVSAAAAGYFYYRGYIAPKASMNRERTSGRHKQRRPRTTVSFVPTIGMDQLGAGLQFEF